MSVVTWLERIPRAVWRLTAVLTALVLIVIAVSNGAFEATTPVSLEHHNVYRKVYALIAFAAIGFFAERSRVTASRGWLGSALLVGGFSLLIELGQIVVDHSTETIAQHGFDVLSGVVGGALGATASRLLDRRTAVSKRELGLAIALAVLIALAYPWSYGRYRQVRRTPALSLFAVRPFADQVNTLGRLRFSHETLHMIRNRRERDAERTTDL